MVLTNVTRGGDIILYLVKCSDTCAGEVDNGATRFNQVTLSLGRSGQT